jgi:hypothetical protein
MANQRADLDVRLELYDMNSSKRFIETKLDSSMYANILWTILATLIICACIFNL